MFACLFISGSMFPSIFLTPWGKYDQRFDSNKENLITGDAEHGHPEQSSTAAHLREAPIWNVLLPFGHCPLWLWFGAVLSTSKWAVSCFRGGGMLPGWFVHFLVHFGNDKKTDEKNWVVKSAPRCLFWQRGRVLSYLAKGRMETTHFKKGLS